MKHDIIFIGHVCLDRLIPYEGEEQVGLGSAVYYGSMAAAGVDCSVAAITRMHPDDAGRLDPLREAGIDCVVIPAEATTRMLLKHPVPDVDVREMSQVASAGFMQVDELPPFESRFVHLAGITDQEYTLPFMRALVERGHSLSVDMQAFVRQVDVESRVISFADAKDKVEIVSLMDRVKMDAVEAELLTGTDDLSEAARIVASWGCPEVVMTRSDGVLALVDGKEYFEPFTNRNSVGRNGRGDTTFAGYMTWRLEHEPAEALKFAAALASIKMETVGPFSGSLDDVLTRMSETDS
ncbi:MAG: PfkB family carbohydrate kinase [Lentisphaeria bacterium]|nr:PfkB family carbohydrate kinase [Lentisphaeria bacterium]